MSSEVPATLFSFQSFPVLEGLVPHPLLSAACFLSSYPPTSMPLLGAFPVDVIGHGPCGLLDMLALVTQT